MSYAYLRSVLMILLKDPLRGARGGGVRRRRRVHDVQTVPAAADLPAVRRFHERSVDVDVEVPFPLAIFVGPVCHLP